MEPDPATQVILLALTFARTPTAYVQHLAVREGKERKRENSAQATSTFGGSHGKEFRRPAKTPSLSILNPLFMIPLPVDFSGVRLTREYRTI
jgi:hypothetical protein